VPTGGLAGGGRVGRIGAAVFASRSLFELEKRGGEGDTLLFITALYCLAGFCGGPRSADAIRSGEDEGEGTPYLGEGV